MKPSKDGYYRRGFTVDGKKYRAFGKTEADMLLDMAEKKAAIRRGEINLDRHMTVRAWSATWLDTYIRPRVRAPGGAKARGTMTQKSYQMYVQKLDNYILPAIGSMRLCDVRDTHLARILNNETGGSYSHVHKLRLVIQSMFRQARISRLIQYDPAESLQLPATTEGHRRSLTDEERDLLLETARTHRCGLWIRTLLDTGIRPGESAPLQVRDFDFKNKLLRITKDMESGSYVVSDPKTAAGIRTVPLPDDLIHDLAAAFRGKTPFDLAFPNTSGKMKSQTSITNDWRSFRREMDIRAGATTMYKNVRMTISTHGYAATAHGHILTQKVDGEDGSRLAPDLQLYCLRHTYCTDLQKAGVSIDIARQLMGHSDIQTTAKIYTHANDVVVQKAAVRINEYRSECKNRCKKTSLKTGTD